MTSQGMQLPTAGHVPQLDRGVLIAGCQRKTVGRKRYRFDGCRMPAKRAQLCAVRDAPQRDRVIRAAGGERAAVRGDGDRRATAKRISGSQAVQYASRNDVPELNGLIAASGGNLV